MKSIKEGSLLFKFDNKWNVFKFDVHNFYRNKIGRLDKTKAVDILGIYERELYFIEIKDFRAHRIENKNRIKNGDLAIEIAQKVRDSVACIVGAWRTEEIWKSYAGLLYDRKKKLKVIIWLETDELPACYYMRQKVRASVSTKVFKKKIAWLTSHVLVCSLKINDLPGVEVCNLKKTNNLLEHC